MDFLFLVNDHQGEGSPPPMKSTADMNTSITQGSYAAIAMSTDYDCWKEDEVPVRKKGKLPCKTIQETYSLEYGSDTLEIHEDTIEKGDKVIIVDDLIATGGTVRATVKLVEKLGSNLIECAFIVELPDLKGRDKIPGCKVFSITEFEGE